ncbi:MAG: NADPH-dependent F420 reductase [Chloroflexi bacterium]|jgi:NADPH-dependent F420 reductase|nr:NADPH-dependent F420 reductase [Chloroflexota bacterium]|tara:strand:- start:725 stop:1378 length:654 start_codon:yes stop_codon:yes gene_type:complete
MLGFLGGTGEEGKGLAFRLALAGESVMIGSRDEARAVEAAAEVNDLLGKQVAIGANNMQTAEESDIVFVTVPYSAQAMLLGDVGQYLKSKIVIDVIAPMSFVRGVGAQAINIENGSAAEEAQELVPESFVVSAFQNVSAAELVLPNIPMIGDVLVCGDDKDSKQRVMELVCLIDKLKPVDGGMLFNSKYVEQITPLLVNINRLYKTHSGIHITGLEE